MFQPLAFVFEYLSRMWSKASSGTRQRYLWQTCIAELRAAATRMRNEWVDGPELVAVGMVWPTCKEGDHFSLSSGLRDSVSLGMSFDQGIESCKLLKAIRILYRAIQSKKLLD
jgi:hypothetical protein